MGLSKDSTGDQGVMGLKRSRANLRGPALEQRGAPQSGRMKGASRGVLNGSAETRIDYDDPLKGQKERILMKKFAILAMAALIAMPASAAGVTISGYIDIGYWAAENPTVGQVNAATPSRLQASNSTAGSWNGNDQFALNNVNIDLNTKFTDDISGYISFDFIQGAAPTIDYAQIDFNNVGPMNNKISVGRFGSVIGIEQRVSESNLNKFINMSLLSPYTTGAVDGIGVFGSFSPVSYAIAISNDDPFGGASITNGVNTPRTRTLAGAVNDNNNNKAIAGRIGVMPLEGLEIGVSASHSVWAAPVAFGVVVPDNKNPARNLVGVDASYVWGALSLKGEYVNIKEEQLNKVAGFENPIKLVGWYAEGWYDWTSKIGVGVRYGRVQTKQNRATVPGLSITDEATDYSTLAIAGAYRVADNVTFKVEYDINDESQLNYLGTAGREVNNDVIAASLVASF